MNAGLLGFPDDTLLNPLGGTFHLKHWPGRYYQPPLSVLIASAMSSGWLTCTPFPVAISGAFDRIGLEVTTFGALSTIRLGIYQDNGLGFPERLLLEAGTIDSTANGFKEIVINQWLNAGLYYLAALCETAAVTVRSGGAAMLTIMAQAATGTDVSTVNSYLKTSVPLGVLPVTCPVGSTVYDRGPRILLRAA